MNQKQFNDLYWAHQPPEVRALRDNTTDQTARMNRALDLALKGFEIDLPIMGYIDTDPYTTMRIRQLYGYTWVPAALQPQVMVAPGLRINTQAAYDPNNPPAGSIKVSLEESDYPPFDPPKPPPPPPVQPSSFVGDFIYIDQAGRRIFYSLAGDPAIDGQLVHDPRGVFRCHATGSGIFFHRYYSLESAAPVMPPATFSFDSAAESAAFNPAQSYVDSSFLNYPHAGVLRSDLDGIVGPPDPNRTGRFLRGYNFMRYGVQVGAQASIGGITYVVKSDDGSPYSAWWEVARD